MKLARYKRYLVIARMNQLRDVACAHVPSLPDADLTICFKCGKIITAGAGEPWHLVTADEIPIELIRNEFDFWVIVNSKKRYQAWSGARWVPHWNGLPATDVQVCNFPTIEEAKSYVEERFPL